MSSLRRMLKFRHGLSAWHGDLDGEHISMYRASPMPFCLLHWSDH